MPFIRLIKYPGTKNALLPTIYNTFEESKSKIFVDVFGGSGIVSLNVNAPQVVYNDLNKELYNMFTAIKLSPMSFLRLARSWTSTKAQFLRYGEILNSKKSTRLNEAEKAFQTFYKFNVGFGGMGSTYRTAKEKSSYTLMSKVLSNYDKISSRISCWEIENRDFRELIRDYDGDETFFYFDPPYVGKNWYEFAFDVNDLVELRNAISEMKGSFLLTFDGNDQEAKRTFGKPDRTIRFENQNRRKVSPTQYRQFSLYLRMRGNARKSRNSG